MHYKYLTANRSITNKVIWSVAIIVSIILIFEIVIIFDINISKSETKKAYLSDKFILGAFRFLVSDDIVKTGDLIELGKYGGGDESLQWIVYDIEKDGILLLSARVVCQREYNDEYESYWSSSSLCKWLNRDFYDEAFTEEEKKTISKQPFAIRTRDWTWSKETDSCLCSVRVLSYYEAIRMDTNILSVGNDYWLISPDFGHCHSGIYVQTDGTIINHDFSYANNVISVRKNDIWVRPVIKINIDEYDGII